VCLTSRVVQHISFDADIGFMAGTVRGETDQTAAFMMTKW